MGSHILSLITFLPLLGALVVALLPRGGHAALRGATLVFSLANLLLSLTVFGVDPNGGMSFKEWPSGSRPWASTTRSGSTVSRCRS